MSEPCQLDLLPAEHVAEMLRKKRFWNRTMWITLTAATTFLLIGSEGNISKMMLVCVQSIDAGSIETGILQDGSSFSTRVALISLPLALIAFFLFIVSWIRCLSLPKDLDR